LNITNIVHATKVKVETKLRDDTATTLLPQVKVKDVKLKPLTQSKDPYFAERGNYDGRLADKQKLYSSSQINMQAF
jgi:hypothetical protein